MLYSFVRPIVKIGFYAYFRKIYLSNTARIPKDKPVILACNHPTGFMEPCILACFLDRPLYFLVRGDFFSKPFYARLLKALHMLPVFRWKDGGYRKLKNNFSTFEACYQALYENLPIMIFAEGNTKYEKRLRPLQKGAARIVFGTLQRYPDIEDVYIVPVGVTYEAAHRPWSRVMIDCGHPISGRDFLAEFDGNPVEGINRLTEAMAAGMRDQIVHVESPGDDQLVENLLELNRNNYAGGWWPPVSNLPIPLEREQRIAHMVNFLTQSKKERLGKAVQNYFLQLQRNGVKDLDIKDLRSFGPGQYLFLAVALLPALLGYLLNWPPLGLAKWIADQRVKFIEFYGPVRFTTATGFYLFFFVFWLVLGIVMWGWPGVFLPVLVLVLGALSLIYQEYFRRWRSRRRAKALPGSEFRALLQQREKVIQLMRDFTDDPV